MSERGVVTPWACRGGLPSRAQATTRMSHATGGPECLSSDAGTVVVWCRAAMRLSVRHRSARFYFMRAIIGLRCREQGSTLPAIVIGDALHLTCGRWVASLQWGADVARFICLGR
jgi:hypothetical protein